LKREIRQLAVNGVGKNMQDGRISFQAGSSGVFEMIGCKGRGSGWFLMINNPREAGAYFTCRFSHNFWIILKLLEHAAVTVFDKSSVY
jgi:hypothetical protein